MQAEQNDENDKFTSEKKENDKEQKKENRGTRKQ